MIITVSFERSTTQRRRLEKNELRGTRARFSALRWYFGRSQHTRHANEGPKSYRAQRGFVQQSDMYGPIVIRERTGSDACVLAQFLDIIVKGDIWCTVVSAPQQEIAAGSDRLRGRFGSFQCRTLSTSCAMRYLTLTEVLGLHVRLIASCGGASGLRDNLENLSALCFVTSEYCPCGGLTHSRRLRRPNTELKFQELRSTCNSTISRG